MLLLNTLTDCLLQVELNVSSSATAAYWRTTWRPLRQNFLWNTDIITGMPLLMQFPSLQALCTLHCKLLEVPAVSVNTTILSDAALPSIGYNSTMRMRTLVLFAVLQLGGDLPPLEVDTTSLSGTVTASSVTETVTGSEPLTGSTVAVEVTLNGQDWTSDGESHLITYNTANFCVVSL
jgi:hypothetical protein